MVERVAKLLLAGAAWASLLVVLWLRIFNLVDSRLAFGGGVLFLIIALGAGWQPPAKGK